MSGEPTSTFTNPLSKPKGTEIPLIAGTLSTSSNAEPTKNEQTTSSNPIKLKNTVCIGIDLGTTYSCVAIVENGKPKIIFNEEGGNFTSSIVSYGDNNEVLVGNHALNYPDLSQVLYDSKRLLGWEFMYDLPIAENRLLWTFDLDARNEAVGYVLNKGTAEERFILPEEVSADILRKLKLIAEEYMGEPITEAVVAIPAFFQTAQIEATKRAIEMAGLELKMLIKEPTAAAIAYNEDKKLENSNIMIFDFGGGTLDINICKIENGKLAIKAVYGDKHLGGQDFDGIIMNYVVQEYKRTSNNDIFVKPCLAKRPRNESEISKNDIFGNKRLVKRLRVECRSAKEALSFNASSYNIHLDIDLDGYLDLNVKLTKIKFNELCKELYTRTSRLIDDTLRMANLGTDDIDHVIMVGGSTRIPAIRDILEMKFGQKKLKSNINPNEAVVFGAAILADAIEKEKQIPLINYFIDGLSRNINSHEILFYVYYPNNDKEEGRICLFNSLTCSVEEIAKFHNCYVPYEVATTQNKIFGIDNESFETFDLSTGQISRGPSPPEWRKSTSVTYFKDKLYYLGGENLESGEKTNCVDVLINGKWQTGPIFPFPIRYVQTITCDGILYVIDGCRSRMIYRLSDDEREWIEIGEIPERRIHFGVASLNGRIYITGRRNYGYDILKSCLCFDPSAPVNSRISRIADMNHARAGHSLIVANGKLYAIGGLQKPYWRNYCNLIEEYDPQTDKWREVKILFYVCYRNNDGEKEGRICLFNSHTCSVEEIAKFHNCYAPYEVAATQNKIFGIDGANKSFEIYDLNTRQILRGLDPPEWRRCASIVYYKDKLYYLGGWDPKTKKDTNRVDVLIDGIWQTGPAFPHSIVFAQTITCDEILYVIDGEDSNKIYRLSDDEREWIEIGEIPERRDSFGVASLNGRIYITGGQFGDISKSCLCFDPSAPVYSRISRIADMNYAKSYHSLVAANGKLYVIGGS